MVKAWAIIFAYGVLAATAKAWAFMLLIGMAHSHEAVIPAFGFWASFGLSLAIQVAAYQYDASKD